MANVAELDLKINSTSAKIANKRLKELEKRGGKTEKATNGLASGFKRLAAPLALVTGAIASLSKLTSVTREFDILNAQLLTATGSAENAGVAFNAIQEFAESTPYDLAQATTAFTKLVNLGLEPSERALTSYGNTASAMGKDLNQMIEAVADAAVGEFERLKEFGIKAKSQGDNVSLTFRGVSTTIKKEADAIEGYLLALGENEFAGSMANRMDTLDGAMSNLGDSWNKLWLEISSQGVGGIIESGVRKAIDALEFITDLVSSGYATALVNDIIGPFKRLFLFIADGWNAIGEIFFDSGEDMKNTMGSTVDFIRFAWTHLPDIIWTSIKKVGIHLGSLVDWAKLAGTNIIATFKESFLMVVELAKLQAVAVGHALNPFDGNDFNLIQELKDLDSNFKTMAANRKAEGKAIAENNRQEKLDAINLESELLTAKIDAHESERASVIRNFKELRAIRGEEGKDVDNLSQFKIKKEETDENGSPLSKQQEKQRKSFDSLVESLLSEEEAIEFSYQKKLAIINEAEFAGTEAKLDAKSRLDAEFMELLIGSNAEVKDAELQAINDLYESRAELVRNHTFETEAERTAIMVEAEKDRTSQIRALEMARAKMVVDGATSIADSLLGLAEETSGRHTAFYKGMFVVTKAFSIAEATMNIATAISAAAAAGPFPANLAAIASTVSATTGLISTIKSASMDFGGAFDKGGFLPAGKVGLVGEFGPELIQGPANITSREDTMRMIKGQSESNTGSGGDTYITNENHVTIAVDNAQGDIVEVLEAKFKDGWTPITEDTDQAEILGV